MTTRTIVSIMSAETDQFEQIKDVVDNDKFFDFPIDLNVWDNDICVNEGDEPLTDDEIAEMNKEFKNKLCTLILEKNFENSPINSNEVEFRMLLKRKFDEITPMYNQLFIIQNQKYKTLWFHDYDVYHDGTNESTLGSKSVTTGGHTDTTTTDMSVGEGATDTAETMTGVYPNVSGSEAYADSKEESTVIRSNLTETDGTVETVNVNDTTTETSGGDKVEDNWHEYRIGATGQTPHDLVKKAYENCRNIVNDFAEEFNDCFYFDFSLNHICW